MLHVTIICTPGISLRGYTLNLEMQGLLPGSPQSDKGMWACSPDICAVEGPHDVPLQYLMITSVAPTVWEHSVDSDFSSYPELIIYLAS